jgi:EmrB/QacA subfamily drug resistance transporter
MGASERIDRDVLRVAMVLIVGALAVIFDSTIVSVALHTLAVRLHASVATIQWVGTGYLLALAVSIPLAAWAQARFGGKRVWLFALAVFMAGSILCSLAWDAPSLIAFRVLQGLGGGLLLPLMSTLVMQAAGGRALGRTMALISYPAVLGPILGPVLGGVILNSLDWRWLFWVNVPFCVVGIVLAGRMLPHDTRAGRVRLDLIGLVLLAPGLAGLLYGLSRVGPVLVPVLAGVVLVAAFVLWSVHAGGRALVDVRLFRHRPVASSSAILFLSAAALYGAMLLLPLYWQQARGATALTAGLLLVPQGIGTLLSRTVIGRLTDTVGARSVALVGFVLVGLATVPFALATASTDRWLLMAVLVVRGVGLGAITVPVMAVAYIGLDRAEVPHASILTRVAQQIGGSFGTALLAVILANAARTVSIAQAFDRAFWWSIGFTAVAVVVALLLPGRPAPVPSEPAARVPAPSVN